MLTSSEIANIEHGLLDIRSMGPDVAVPFEAHKLLNASVAWINERWFLERRIDITDERVRARLDKWLIEEYAFLVPLETDSSSDFGITTKTFLADSYGSSTMATHGGSGRVGITGRFQVKGIGRTPLVGVACDWLHSHGCLWLEEALREAVYSEVTAVEFPHGAVPILAVLDTGLRHMPEGGEPGEWRALTIRPVVVRPAYFERAVLFQPPGEEHIARKRDVERVKQVVQYFENRSRQSGALTLAEQFNRTFIRIAEQIAFSRAQRLFPGNYASSNMSIDGELLDFGPFRALPNWCRSISMNDVEGFGNEIVEITEAATSLSFYINKYKSDDSEKLNSSELLKNYTEALDEAFAREVLYLFHLEEVDDANIRQAALSALFDYYRIQQRVEVRFQNGCVKKLDWLSDVFVDGKKTAAPESFEDAVWSKLDSAIMSSGLGAGEKAVLRQRMRTTAARLLPGRLEIQRESLVILLNGIIAERDAGSGPERSVLEGAVNRIVSRNRRHWPFVPRNLSVLAQFSSPRCAVLYCLDLESGQYFLWVEAALLNDHVWCLDKWVERSVIDSCTYKDSDGCWRGLLPANSLSAETTLAGLELRIPDSAMWFAPDKCATV